MALAPAKAQTPGPPASIEISEPLGSLSRLSYFELTATVTDSNGNAVTDNTPVSWSVSYAASWSEEFPLRVPDDSSNIPGDTLRFLGVSGGDHNWDASPTTDGKVYGLFRVLGREAEIAVTVAAASGTIHATRFLTLGDSEARQPPDPARIGVSAPLELRRTDNRFTVHATVIDANGAPVPDGTPITWMMAASSGNDARFTAVTKDSTTADGRASANYEAVPGSGFGNVGVLATARAGSTSYTVWFPTDEGGPSIAVTSDTSRWKLLKVGDVVTVTATATEPDGTAVADDTQIDWYINSQDVSGALVAVSSDAVTVSGSASAVYRVVHTAAYLAWVTAQVAAGRSTTFFFYPDFTDRPDPPDDLALSLRLPSDSDNVVPTDSTLRVGADLTYTGQGQTVYVSDGALRVAGSQEWESGRRRLTVAGQTVQTYSATNPDTCKGVSVDGQTDWTCAVELDDATIHIPAGTPDGTFTISGVITVNGREYRDTLEVTVVAPNAIDEVAEVQFDFAEQVWGANRGEPYPANVPVGGETKLRLKILNENGSASAEGSIGSVLLTTSAGTLSTRIGGGCVGGGGAACQIPVSAVTAVNADQIDVTLTHPGPNKSGRGEVRATVLAIDGETFAPPALSVSFAGEAASLAISEPASGLLHTATDADDHRDVLKLTVGAADAAGNSVAVPYRAPRAVIRGPDGKVVTSGISVVWTEDGDDSDDAHDRFIRNTADAVEATVRVTAAAADPLKLGVYTLELRTAGLSATQKFTVVGGTDSVALSEPTGELRVNGTISLTATLRDAEGNPVPDGTPVSWAERSTGQSAVLVRLATDGATTDGASTATFFAVGAGTAVVSAESGGVSDVALLRIAAAPPAGGAAEREPQLGESLSTQGAPGLATWLGANETSASALLDALSGIDSIQLWSIDRWLRYSRGADDFAIQPGAVLWLSR